MRAFATWCWARRLGAAGWAAVAVFALLVAPFWHPAYGFTKFLQIDETDEAGGIHELRENPIYFYAGENGYDGTAYAQIAFHPLLDSPELAKGIDSLPYRARRILGSAVAWVLAGGAPARIAKVYAALNVGVWLLLAGLLWRLLPVQDWRGWVGWAGLMFSAGALHAVRLALTDLPGVTLFAATMWLAERGRPRLAAGALALGGLARETVLAQVVALLRGPWLAPRAWLANAGRAAAVAGPLAAWMWYVRWKAGSADPGLGNFTWPVSGFVEKWGAAVSGLDGGPFAWLKATTLLATIGLTVQAAYFCRRWRPDEAWWRAGIVGVAMMAMLGTAVWEGHPGAATRVLLPMGLAFAVLAVRDRAAPAWLVLGNLSVFSGVLALWHVPKDPGEIAAGRFDGGAYVVRLEAGWSGREHNTRHEWAWAADRGRLAIRSWPPGGAPVRVRLGLKALAPRTVEIRQGDTVLWRGEVGPELQRIELDGVRPGEAELEFATDAPPVRENDRPEARALGFAVYDVTIE